MMGFVRKRMGIGRKLMGFWRELMSFENLVYNVRNPAKCKELNTDLIIGTVFVTIVVGGLGIVVAILGRLYYLISDFFS